MNAIKLLEAQHAEVEKLFDEIEKAKEPRRARSLFEQLAAKLVAHDAIEREIFYPACEAAMGMTDRLGEALVEHGLVEFSLYQADVAKAGEGFAFKVEVLREVVEHHVGEEEESFFPAVTKALGKDVLEDLGTRMQARFEQALATDFREPLHENLRQVLAGAIKTTKATAARAPTHKVTRPARHA